MRPAREARIQSMGGEGVERNLGRKTQPAHRGSFIGLYRGGRPSGCFQMNEIVAGGAANVLFRSWKRQHRPSFGRGSPAVERVSVPISQGRLRHFARRKSPSCLRRLRPLRKGGVWYGFRLSNGKPRLTRAFQPSYHDLHDCPSGPAGNVEKGLRRLST